MGKKNVIFFLVSSFNVENWDKREKGDIKVRTGSHLTLGAGTEDSSLFVAQMRKRKPPCFHTVLLLLTFKGGRWLAFSCLISHRMMDEPWKPTFLSWNDFLWTRCSPRTPSPRCANSTLTLAVGGNSLDGVLPFTESQQWQLHTDTATPATALLPRAEAAQDQSHRCSSTQQAFGVRVSKLWLGSTVPDWAAAFSPEEEAGWDWVGARVCTPI